MADKETPEQQKERLKLQELKDNPTGNLNDAFNESQTGGQGDFGWKGTGVLILVLIVGYIIYSIFFAK